MFRGKVRHIHFVGIGGIGMSGIAEVLLTLGFSVTGSDLREGASVRRLRELGAKVFVGHDPSNVQGVDVVVRSTAVGSENLEVAEAHRLLIPVIRRAEMLAELMRLKHGIAVAGSHGKTTTTSMLAECLGSGGLDPTVVIGGRVNSLGGSNARLGAGEYLVAEADESDGSFMLLSPTVAMITNIDPEHLDHYGSVDALEHTFLEFANKVPFYGFTVLCLDHPAVQRLIPQVGRPVVTYGFSRQADYRASGIEHDGLITRFEVFQHERSLGQLTLHLPGLHNATNAVGAVAVAMELNVPFEDIQRALHGFAGVQRRFTVRGEAADVIVIDDYGHHPVEIRATLRAAEEGFPGRRIVAVFQPHRYSRVVSLWSDFLASFNRAAVVVVCPVYAAGETPSDGVDHRRFAGELRGLGHRGTVEVDGVPGALSWLLQHVVEGDVVITLGAGDVNAVCDPLVASLETR